jgi:hypothetical protein
MIGTKTVASESGRKAPYEELTHESTYSILALFAYRNAVRYSEIYRYYTGSKNPSASCRFFAERSGWKPVADTDLIRLSGSDKERRIWQGNFRFLFDEEIRICPHCLAGGFHSLWFQLSLLVECPIHKCRLTKHCENCGAALGMYGITKDLFGSAYECSVCRRPICGSPISLSDIADFRGHSASLVSALMPIAEWYSDVESRVGFVGCLWRQYFFEGKLSVHWLSRTYANAMLTSLCLQSVAFPEGCTGHQRMPVMHLTWEHPASQADHSQNDDGDVQGAYSIARRLQIAIADSIYRCTLIQLFRWLRNTDLCAFSHDGSTSLSWTGDGKVDASKHDSRVIAYWLMRHLVETQGALAPVTGRIRDAKVTRRFLNFVPHGAVRSNKTAWRAYFLAFYAGIYHFVARRSRSGTFDVREIQGVEFQAILIRTDAEEGPQAWGVFFPSVPCLPLVSV